MKKIVILISLLAITLTPLAFAQPQNTPSHLQLKNSGGLSNPNSIFPLIDRIANWLFAILLTIAVVYVLLAAYTYLTSKGGEGVEKGHKMLLWAAVAIAVAILSKGFVNVVRILITNENLPQ